MQDPKYAGLTDLCKHKSGDTLPFYEAEGQVLELWDQLHELKLEQAILEAQANVQSEQPANDDVTEEQVKDAEKEFVEVRATYHLRQSAIEDVLVADPMLKAVHAGINATSAERNLKPLLDRRDTLGLSQSNVLSILQELEKKNSKVEAENSRVLEKNKALTATYLEVLSKTQALLGDASNHDGMETQLAQAKKDANTARIRWRIIKSVMAAVIVGSGVAWAQDETLRELVFDSEEED